MARGRRWANSDLAMTLNVQGQGKQNMMGQNMSYPNSRRILLATGEHVHFMVREGPKGASRCLLLHGNPDDMQAWTQVIESFGPNLEVVALDLPGFGRSSRAGPSPLDVSLDRLASCCIALVDALGWNEPFFVVGHSHGGAVAQVVAAKHPTRVTGIVLISSLGVSPHSNYRLLALAPAVVVVRFAGWILRAQRLRFMGRWVVRRVMWRIWWPQRPPERRVDQELSRLAEKTEVLVTMAHVTKDNPCRQLLQLVPELCCPALIVHGAKDALVPFEHARGLFEAMSAAGVRCVLECLPDAGHAVLECEATAIAQLIEGFVERRVREGYPPLKVEAVLREVPMFDCLPHNAARAAALDAMRSWSEPLALVRFARARHGYENQNGYWGIRYPGDLDEFALADKQPIPAGYVEALTGYGSSDEPAHVVLESEYLELLRQFLRLLGQPRSALEIAELLAKSGPT